MSIPVEIPGEADPFRGEMKDIAEVMGKILGIPMRFIPASFEVDDKECAEILRSFLRYAFDADRAKRSKGKKVASVIPSGTTSNAMSHKAYRWVDTGEIITSQALTKLLNSSVTVPGNPLEHRVLENHKGERFVIENVDGFLCKIKEPKE